MAAETPRIIEFRALAKGEKVEGQPKVDAGLPVAYHDIFAQGRKEETQRLLLVWEGTKVPRGVALPGGVIGWTQHGMVVGQNGEDLGTYDRIEEFGGPGKNRHTMVIHPNSR